MIHVRELTKRFGRTTAIDGLTFTIGRGELVGLLGPNGAGKTTTMRILAGFLPPTGGVAEIDGADVSRDSREVRRRIGYLPENVPLYREMRVRGYLEYRGTLKGLRGRVLRQRVDAVLEQCGLLAESATVIGRLSKGYRQRVGLADALVHEPEVLILDEPTIGLDPGQIRHIRELIRGLSEHYTVLLSSHILSEVEMICRRVLIMNRGRIVAADTTAALKGMWQGHERVALEALGPRRAMMTALEAIPGVLSLTCLPEGDWSRMVCACEKGSDLRAAIFRAVVAQGWTLRELTLIRQNLEDVFAAVIDRETLADAGPESLPAGNAPAAVSKVGIARPASAGVEA